MSTSWPSGRALEKPYGAIGMELTQDNSRAGVVDDGMVAWPEGSSRLAGSGRKRLRKTSSAWGDGAGATGRAGPYTARPTAAPC